MRARYLLLLPLFLVASTLQADAQSLAGKWTAKYPMRVQNVNGQITADTGTAVLVIEQKGDSVFGTWQPQNTPVAVQPRVITGTFKDGVLQFTAGVVDAKIRRDGDEQTVPMRAYFEGKLAGDELSGTTYSAAVDGSIASGKLSWSARRETAK